MGDRERKAKESIPSLEVLGIIAGRAEPNRLNSLRKEHVIVPPSPGGTMNSIPPLTNHAVATYSTHDQAEAAIKTLSDSGFDMRQLSIIGQNYATEEHPLGFVNTGDRMLSWGKLGAFWGSIWGILFGSAMVFLPGLGYLMFAGWIVGALEGAVVGGGLAALGAAMASIGIPDDSRIRYESELKAGSFLLLAHGDESEVLRAKKLLEGTSPTNLETYSNKQVVGSGV